MGLRRCRASDSTKLQVLGRKDRRDAHPVADRGRGLLRHHLRRHGIALRRRPVGAPDVVARVAAIEIVCTAHGVPLKAAALQFPLAHPAVSCVVAGVRSGVEIEDNASMMSRPIPSACWRNLHAGGLLPADAPVPAAT